MKTSTQEQQLLLIKDSCSNSCENSMWQWALGTGREGGEGEKEKGRGWQTMRMWGHEERKTENDTDTQTKWEGGEVWCVLLLQNSIFSSYFQWMNYEFNFLRKQKVQHWTFFQCKKKKTQIVPSLWDCTRTTAAQQTCHNCLIPWLHQTESDHSNSNDDVPRWFILKHGALHSWFKILIELQCNTVVRKICGNIGIHMWPKSQYLD